MSAIETKKRVPINPTSDLLNMHLTELGEECARFVALLQALQSMATIPEWMTEDERSRTDADLYASLSHLSHHVQPALDEWDRLIDEMPDDDED
ncbi:MAG TPA: hypothetical protein VJZ26_18105 [Blastocatellia bacterium]|nr:hypothetical protein [Blastocatellia bacterium]